MILVDTREKIDKMKRIEDYFDKVGMKYVRSPLKTGDYMIYGKDDISVDRKYNLTELMQNITQKRFKNELIRSKESGTHLVILCEHSTSIKSIADVESWKNPRLEHWKFKCKKELGLFGELNEWYLYKQMKAAGKPVRRPPQSSTQLMKALQTIQDNKEDYDCSIQFCSKAETGKRILEILGVEK